MRKNSIFKNLSNSDKEKEDSEPDSKEEPDDSETSQSEENPAETSEPVESEVIPEEDSKKIYPTPKNTPLSTDFTPETPHLTK